MTASSTDASPLLLARRLSQAGIEAWESGESLRCLLDGTGRDASGRGAAPSVIPLEMTALCSLDDLLAALPSAIPIRPAEAIALAPSKPDPIEIRCLGSRSLEGQLASRDFTVHALARNPLDGAIIDPLGGVADLEDRVLRLAPACAGPLARRRGLRAARLRTLGYRLDSVSHETLEKSRLDLIPEPRAAAAELGGLLLSKGPAGAVSGLETLDSLSLLVPLLGERARKAISNLDALPRELALRLAAVIGPGATRKARKLGFRRSVVAAIERLHRHHPLDDCVDLRRPSQIRRLARSLSTEEVERLAELRSFEALSMPEEEARPVREQLSRIERAIASAQARADSPPPPALALGGNEVMTILGCKPGPQVGRVLGRLRRLVTADPALNTPEKLRAQLLRWAADDGPTPSPGAPR